MKYKGYISGMRWLRLKEILFEGAIVYNLNINFISEDKGIFRTTIYYEIYGDEKNIKHFLKTITAISQRIQ